MSINYTTVNWANNAAIYEVNIRQYSPEGSFAAFGEQLPRLKDMGIKILWFMPITPISKKNRLCTLGSYYACSSYISINPEYGSLDDFKALVRQAHALDMKVIIDWVANHTGWDHEWTLEHSDWYLHDAQGNFYDAHGWNDVIDLDYSNSAMRKAMTDAMQYWIETCNIDGFRCDMAHLVPLDFWKAAREACDKLKPLFWLAECEVNEYHAVFDASYGWEWMHVSEKLVQEVASFSHYCEVLDKYAALPAGAQKLLFTSNHDENSWNGTEYEKYGDAAKMMAVFTCVWRAMPMVYSGQELPNYKRLAFFEKDPIPWNNQPPALHAFYKTLLTFRLGNKAFDADSAYVILNTGTASVFAYLLVKADAAVLALFNFSKAARVKFTITNTLLDSPFQNIFSGLVFNFAGSVDFEMQPWEYMVYSKVLNS